jgi:hypothetical protein
MSRKPKSALTPRHPLALIRAPLVPFRLLPGVSCRWPVDQQATSLGQVAQLVEQRTENPRVGSSILPLATILVRWALRE